jgi:cytochrome c oxidase subunit 2
VDLIRACHDPAGRLGRTGRRLALAGIAFTAAFQWSRRFVYENTPVGQPVRIKLRSADVVHSFFVPQTLFKRQAIPGIINEFDLTFDKVGLYHGQCTQFCGLAHTDMAFRVRVVSQGEYQQWLASAARTGATGPPGR